MVEDLKKCFLCDYEKANLYEYEKGLEHIKCKKCGDYYIVISITGEDEFKKKRHLIAGFVRENTDRKSEPIVISDLSILIR